LQLSLKKEGKKQKADGRHASSMAAQQWATVSQEVKAYWQMVAAVKNRREGRVAGKSGAG
jgi:hypothetical protein